MGRSLGGKCFGRVCWAILYQFSPFASLLLHLALDFKLDPKQQAISSLISFESFFTYSQQPPWHLYSDPSPTESSGALLLRQHLLLGLSGLRPSVLFDCCSWLLLGLHVVLSGLPIFPLFQLSVRLVASLADIASAPGPRSASRTPSRQSCATSRSLGHHTFSCLVFVSPIFVHCWVLHHCLMHTPETPRGPSGWPSTERCHSCLGSSPPAAISPFTSPAAPAAHRR